MDWDFTFFTSSRDDPDQLYGLRHNLYFPFRQKYYLVILGDLVLRFAWLSKFTGYEFPSQEGGIFLLNFLEVFRRWVWIFFRVEAEWGACHNISYFPSRELANSFGIDRNNRTAGYDDSVLLGEIKAPSRTRIE